MLHRVKELQEDKLEHLYPVWSSRSIDLALSLTPKAERKDENSVCYDLLAKSSSFYVVSSCYRSVSWVTTRDNNVFSYNSDDQPAAEITEGVLGWL